MAEIASPDTAAPRSHGLRARLGNRPELVLSPILLVLVLAGWEWGVRFFQVPSYMLPRVSKVLFGLYQGFAISPLSRGGYWLNGGVTLVEVVLGFLIGCSIGLVLGILISQIRLLDATLRPYIVAFQCLPKVAIAPIIIMWFGYDITSKVVMVALLTFFPLLVNSMAGFHGVDLDRIELLRSLSATRWQIFWKVKFPSALPFIFAGLDIAAVFAVVGAIVGEFVGAQLGLGVQILSMNAQMDTAGSFSVCIVLAVMGLALNGAIRAVQRRVLFWAPSAASQRAINL
ncbi:MAG TPA: ABC transporter permease [Stellaceae bacterium]|jgi:NitT/TauT family transport system permease protein|nr:ABC transporter permease [Stellaceae bacterium]